MQQGGEEREKGVEQRRVCNWVVQRELERMESIEVCYKVEQNEKEKNEEEEEIEEMEKEKKGKGGDG